MATDYSETILSDTIAALQSIRSASGYNYDLKGAERWDRFAHPEFEPPYAIVDRLSQLGRTSGSESLEELQLGIDLVITQDQASAERTSVIEGKWLHDVRKALAAKFTLQSYVTIEQVLSTPFHIQSEDEPDDGLSFVVTLTYSTDYADPSLLVSPQ